MYGKMDLGKRKSEVFLEELLSEDLVEKVLSRLPTSSFFRLRSVCKRWKSVADSPTFLAACSGIPTRDPWFFMANDPDPNLNCQIIFDSAEGNWKQLLIDYQPRDRLLLHEHMRNSHVLPMAASGGLICFRSALDELIVSNPLTGCFRRLPPPPPHNPLPLQAIAMKYKSKPDQINSYKLVLISGNLTTPLSIQVYNSSTEKWEEERVPNRSKNLSNKAFRPESNNDNDNDNAMYFLSKTGDVVATTMQRSPSKQYSSIFITSKEDEDEDGKEVIYFLSSSGTIVSCNLTHKCYYEYPRLLPAFSDYSIDVVECGGEMAVVVLFEFLESASLRVWKFNEGTRNWDQIAAMPPAMSHDLYGKKVDINCCGAGEHRILVCLNGVELCGYVLCDVRTNLWVELPPCYVDGQPKEFMSAFCFEPRIEASV